MARKVVLSGMRPTGKLHVGNHWGALKNWLAFQDQYDCFFCVADWHMLTTRYEETVRLQENVRDMALDWLAAGLDPARCTVFLQSAVPQHAELTLLLSMVTPISWLENNPTYKEQLQELGQTKLSKALEEQGVLSAKQREKMSGEKLEEVEPSVESAVELRTAGFLNYPVLQTADIVLYDAELVPVGQDQLPHLEIAREIVRRFNSIYGQVLIEPQAKLTPTPKVPGIDGRKMSKSYDNALDLFETPEGLKGKVGKMYTDPLKVRKHDKGHPEPCAENPKGCTVFAFHKLYSADVAKRGEDCRSGALGCVTCKGELSSSLEGPFAAFRRERERLAADSGLVERVLAEGGRKAAEVAERTMARVRKAMHLR